jgi:hypothetical protein
MQPLTGAPSVAAPRPHAACKDVLIVSPAAWASRPLADRDRARKIGGPRRDRLPGRLDLSRFTESLNQPPSARASACPQGELRRTLSPRRARRPPPRPLGGRCWRSRLPEPARPPVTSVVVPHVMLALVGEAKDSPGVDRLKHPDSVEDLHRSGDGHGRNRPPRSCLPPPPWVEAGLESEPRLPRRDVRGSGSTPVDADPPSRA